MADPCRRNDTAEESVVARAARLLAEAAYRGHTPVCRAPLGGDCNCGETRRWNLAEEALRAAAPRLAAEVVRLDGECERLRRERDEERGRAEFNLAHIQNVEGDARDAIARAVRGGGGNLRNRPRASGGEAERNRLAGQLASLRAAINEIIALYKPAATGETVVVEVFARPWRQLDAALTDTASASEAHDARVAAKALMDAADAAGGMRTWSFDTGHIFVSAWLKARASAIRSNPGSRVGGG